MDNNLQALIGLAAFGLLGGAGVVIYRWWQDRRVSRVKEWVHEYLRGRYGASPDSLNINCSYDTYWPVLVNYKDPKSGLRRYLQFSCPGAYTTFALLSEKEDGHKVS